MNQQQTDTNSTMNGDNEIIVQTDGCQLANSMDPCNTVSNESPPISLSTPEQYDMLDRNADSNGQTVFTPKQQSRKVLEDYCLFSVASLQSKNNKTNNSQLKTPFFSK